MTDENPIIKPLDSRDDKARITIRRLLLAKQLFLHGLDHSSKAGPLNKMIAMHNLHNAVEVVLRAIFLHYEIRAEKELNIGFENMLGEIDKFSVFKGAGIKFPYRQEMRNLNQVRNLIQHHANEPAASVVEEARVFTRRFLIQTCETYFRCNFETLSFVSMVEDEQLKELLSISLSEVEAENFQKSLTLAEVSFYWASRTILNFLPTRMVNTYHDDFPEIRAFARNLSETLNNMRQAMESSSFHNIGFHRNEFRDLEKLGEHLSDTISASADTATYYAALFSSGVELADYKHFKECTVVTHFSGSTSYPQGITTRKVSVHWGDMKPTKQDALWVHNFVVTTIVHWQVLGLAPCVPKDADSQEYLKIILDWGEHISIQ